MTLVDCCYPRGRGGSLAQLSEGTFSAGVSAVGVRRPGESQPVTGRRAGRGSGRRAGAPPPRSSAPIPAPPLGPAPPLDPSLAPCRSGADQSGCQTRPSARPPLVSLAASPLESADIRSQWASAAVSAARATGAADPGSRGIGVCGVAWPGSEALSFAGCGAGVPATLLPLEGRRPRPTGSGPRWLGLEVRGRALCQVGAPPV